MGYYKALSGMLADPFAQALQAAKSFFEPQLRSLGFGEDQIQEYNLAELELALNRVNDTLEKADSFRTLGFEIAVESGSATVLIVKDRSKANFEIGITPILLERKKLILERINDLNQSQVQVESLRDLVNQVEDEEIKAKLLREIAQLESAQAEAQKVQVEKNKVTEKQLEEDEKIKLELSRINIFRERSKVWLSFLERESVATVIGAILLVVITFTQIIAIFSGVATSEILNNSFLVILGYFFGQAANQKGQN